MTSRLRLLPFLSCALSLGALAQQTIDVQPLTAINTSDHEYAPRLTQGQLWFTTQPLTASRLERAAMMTAAVYGSFDENRSLRSVKFGPVRALSQELSSPLHESVATATPDGELIVFARNADSDKGKRTNYLYSSFRGSLEYMTPEALPFNDREFNNLHPSFCPEGYRLLFASDRPGGFGGFDLYYAERTADGWGPATNLGDQVNTEADEVFPYWGAGDFISFSSNRTGGLGRLDLYTLAANGATWGAPIHLPAPINSTANDHGLSVSESEGLALFSSDRGGGRGGDDLYAFGSSAYFEVIGHVANNGQQAAELQRSSFGLYLRPGPPQLILSDSVHTLTVQVVDDQIGAPIADAVVRRVGSDEALSTNAKGQFQLTLSVTERQEAAFTIEKQGHAPTEFVIADGYVPSLVTMSRNQAPDTLTLLGHFSSSEAALVSLGDELATALWEVLQKAGPGYELRTVKVELLAGLSPKLAGRLEASCREALQDFEAEQSFDFSPATDEIRLSTHLRVRATLLKQGELTGAIMND